MFKIFGIGHRDLKEEDKIRQEISDSLDYFINVHGKISCISSLAKGADTLFIEEALKKKCPIEIILPFPKDEFEKDFDTNSLLIFQDLISQLGYSCHTDQIPKNQNERNKAYLEAGQKIVSQCDSVLAIWDGEDSAGLGGTKDQIDFTISLNKSVHWIKALKKSKDINKHGDEETSQSVQFNLQDAKAILFKKKYHNTWVLGIYSGLLTVFAIESNFNFEGDITTQFFLTFLGIGSLILSFFSLTIRAKKFKSLFINHRHSAEIFRSKIWESDLIKSCNPNSYSKEELDLDSTFFQSKKRKLWIFIQRQIIYQKEKRINPFTRKLSQYSNILFLLRLILLSNLLSMIIYYGICFYLNTRGFEFFNVLFDTLCMAIPPIYASIEGVIHFNEWSKNKQISIETVNLFITLQSEIIECKQIEALNHIEKKLVSSFTFEISKWVEDEKNKNLEVKI
jgi:hypothetical protein